MVCVVGYAACSAHFHTGGILWDERIPKDVIDWLKLQANDFHAGSGFNVVEMYCEIPKAES
eukprot:6265784-Alexandrium_andersonii.AAC.1